jgi:lysophospholipase L1-like esterase
MRIELIRYGCLLVLLNAWITQCAEAQEADYYLGNIRYSFINYDANELILPGQDSSFRKFFVSLNSILDGDTAQLRIVHMGGSHLQSDLYTRVMRTRLQQMSPDLEGSRGLIFPYLIAHTNSPSTYTVKYTGHWTSCRSTRTADRCPLGLTGMAVNTADPEASMDILLRCDSLQFSCFNCIRIFHEPSSYRLIICIENDSISGDYDNVSGCTGFILPVCTNNFRLNLIKTTETGEFSLLGISLDNDYPGIVYNSVGVNGARLSSFLRCELYEKHLKAIRPDLIIFSIGTNDGYTRDFNPELFYKEYRELIQKTKITAPESAILLTVPNDSYLYRKYVNRNTEQIRKIIIQLASEFRCGIWDFFTVMGGLNSAESWYSAGLMGGDRVHFTKKGYELKGELFFSAFLKSWEIQLPEIIE